MLKTHLIFVYSLGRKLRVIRKQLKANMSDRELLEEFKEMQDEKAKFELDI